MIWLLSLIAFGSLGFWLLSILTIIVIIACLEYENGFKASLTMIMFLGLMFIANHLSFQSIVQWNWRYIIGFIIGYVILGVVWSVVKWYFYVSNKVEQYVELKSLWFRNNSNATELTELSAGQKEKFAEYISRRPDASAAPQASQNKSTILMWMTYWPFSAVWTLINDPIKKLFRMIYTKIVTQLQVISDHLFKGVKSDMDYLTK